jgi:formate dehydrogenase major subunit
MYSKGNVAKGEKADIFHIEGDPDHPTNRGTLCPKGAGLLEMVHSKTRTLYPQIRQPGSDKFERVSWDTALDRVARLMKDDRDKNFITKNNDGVTVNRWVSIGFLAASATSNRNGVGDLQVVRSAGILAFDTKHAFDTAQRWPVWPQHSAVVRWRIPGPTSEHGPRHHHGQQCRRGAQCTASNGR